MSYSITKHLTSDVFCVSRRKKKKYSWLRQIFVVRSFKMQGSKDLRNQRLQTGVECKEINKMETWKMNNE